MCWNCERENVSVDEYVKALRELFLKSNRFSRKEKQLLTAFLNSDDHSASDEELSHATGYAPEASSRQIGKIGVKIAEALGKEPTNRYKNGEFKMFPFVGLRHGRRYDSNIPDDDKRYGRWVMNENLAMAMKELAVSVKE